MAFYPCVSMEVELNVPRTLLLANLLLAISLCIISGNYVVWVI